MRLRVLESDKILLLPSGSLENVAPSGKVSLPVRRKFKMKLLAQMNVASGSYGNRVLALIINKSNSAKFK